MNRLLKNTVLTAAVAATTLGSLPFAHAGDNTWRHHKRYDHSRNSADDLAVAGLLGLAAGALVVGLASQQPAYDPEPVYREPAYAPRPRPDRDYPIAYERPQVAYADRYESLEPWTPGWYDYCADRYRSFNERTGTYTGYDGLKHFCVAD